MEKSYIRAQICNVLYKLRAEKRLRQKEVAMGINMDQGTYSRTEKGLRDPTLTDVFIFAEFYGILPSTLIEMFQNKPADLAKIAQVQLEIEEALRENRFLKQQLEEERNKLV